MFETTRRHLRQLTGLINPEAFKRFARDNAGNVLPMMAAAMFVLAALVGGGVDMARAYKAERRLQAACDAGVLAGRHAVKDDGFDETVTSAANTYFNANFADADEEAYNTSFTPSSDNEGMTVTGTASTTVDTAIMRIFGKDKFDIAVTCSASMGVGNSDIVFVLDNTGSMADEPDGTSPEYGELSKLQSLKVAMKEFYETVADSVEGSNARIRYGFVPYSTTVNVGRLLQADWIANSITVPSRQTVSWGAVSSTWTGSDTSPVTTSNGNDRYSETQYSSSANCTTAKNALAVDTTWQNYGSSYTDTKYYTKPTEKQLVEAVGTHQPQRMKIAYSCKKSGSKYYIYVTYNLRETTSYDYKARPWTDVTTNNANYSTSPTDGTVLQDRTFDTSVYKTFVSTTIPFGTSSGKVRNASYTWNGCIQERQTTNDATFSFVSLATGITPTASDLDIDSVPSSDATKWRPQWPGVTYARAINTTYALANGASSASAPCPRQSKLLTVLDEDAFNAYVDDLNATGQTYHDIGLIWGARLSSPTGLFSSNVNEAPDNGATVSRHVIFMTDGELNPGMNINSAYGIEQNERRVTPDGLWQTAYDRHQSRYLAICEAIKARGIRLWVIAFGDEVELSAELVACATDGLASAFKADNAEELSENFQEIAKQVGELRITQ